MRKGLLAAYCAGHLLTDLACAFLIFRTLDSMASPAACLLAYNFCAFAMQMPPGVIADKLDRNGPVSCAGCMLVALAYLLPAGLSSCTAAGLGNALFHLGGGIDVLNGSHGSFGRLGAFVAPGALGIFLGRTWGSGAGMALYIPPALMVLAAGAILALSLDGSGFRSGNAPCRGPDGREAPVLAMLFGVVVLRSLMGTMSSFPWAGSPGMAACSALALAGGKAAGGLLADRLGAVRASVLSLGAAAVLYLFAGHPAAGLAAVFLFNMTMPVTLGRAAASCPGAKGFSFGLLTFALFLGFLPGLIPVPGLTASGIGPAGCAVISIASLAVLVPALMRAGTGSYRERRRTAVNGLLRSLLVSLSLTMAIEVPLSVAAGVEGKKGVGLVALMNILTNPPAVYVSMLVLSSLGYLPLPVILMIEAAVVLVEWFVYGKYMPDCDHPFALALGLNICSYGFGWIFDNAPLGLETFAGLLIPMIIVGAFDVLLGLAWGVRDIRQSCLIFASGMAARPVGVGVGFIGTFILETLMGSGLSDNEWALMACLPVAAWVGIAGFLKGKLLSDYGDDMAAPAAFGFVSEFVSGIAMFMAIALWIRFM